MNVLVLNCGSSSAKFAVIDPDTSREEISGIAQRIGSAGATLDWKRDGTKDSRPIPGAGHEQALRAINSLLGECGLRDGLVGVGHRVVHGGSEFAGSMAITPEVIAKVVECIPLGPLHNPPNLTGIRLAQELFPELLQVAVFDTAFHQTMPGRAYMYALPYELYEKHGIRRYGFHGTSFLYVAKRAALLLGKEPFDCNLVCLHIGNGVSANAIKKGCSYDTSMGLTPLEGLVMGTRSGDHDAAIDLMVMEKEGKTPKEMNDLLNKKSGLLGITGKHTDRRDVQQAAEAGDARARLAIEVESYRIKKYIGAYSAAIGGADAIVFTAGVGEMSDLIREKSLEGLEFLGIKLDKEKNKLAKTRNAETEISAADSKVKVFVIPTDEERVNIEDVIAMLEGKYDEHTRFSYRFQSADYVNSQREQDFVKECETKPGLKAIQVKPKKKS